VWRKPPATFCPTIRCYRPRRVRYILLDRITTLQPPELARGIKCVSLSDDIFTDHFPGHPIMPGALILESLAQLAGVLLEQTMRARVTQQPGGPLDNAGELHALLTMIDRAKFRHIVRPGDKLELEARGLRVTEDGGQANGVATVDGQRVAEAQLSFAFARVTNPTMLAKRRAFLDVWLTGSDGVP
jgi:3-hydroxymyristoyl/3-hydroxydecanoyl-(acyl carrier protein) dehydratase